MNPNSENECSFKLADKIGIVVVSCLLCTIAAWMFWIVSRFADGGTWWDFVVRMVLYDLIFSIVVCACALAAYAFFPQHMHRTLEKALQHLSLYVIAIIAFVWVTLVFVSLVLPVASLFGLLD